jgi:hypothetical protein
MIRIIFALLFLFFFYPFSFAQTVYVTETGSKYHSSGCSYLKKSSNPIDIKDAVGKGYTPCSKCNPGTSNTIQSESKVKNDSPPNTKSTTTKQKSNNHSSSRIRCQAITKKGKQCKRWAQAGSNYCWQHQK